MVFAFFIGALVSLVEGSFIGSASIGMSLVAYVLLGNIHTIRQLDGISQSLLIFLLIGIYLALHRLTLSLIGVSTSGLSYLISAGVSALLWRPFCNGLDLIRFRLGRLL
jgi:rod shape-determining protein MreD